MLHSLNFPQRINQTITTVNFFPASADLVPKSHKISDFIFALDFWHNGCISLSNQSINCKNIFCCILITCVCIIVTVIILLLLFFFFLLFNYYHYCCCCCYVWVNSSREHPPGQTPGHTPGIWKNCSNARLCGKFLLANAPPPVPSVVVKCPALQSIRSIYKVFGCHILINITVSAQ